MQNGETIAFRVTASEKGLIKEVCDKRGENISSFVRRAIRKELASLGFYPNDIKKALGMKTE